MKNNKYLLFLLSMIYLVSGLIICYYFMWIRLFKERLPTEILFSWNLWLFLLYSVLFVLNVYLLKQKIYPKESTNKFLNEVKKYILEPFIIFIVYWYKNSMKEVLNFFLGKTPFLIVEEKIQPVLMNVLRGFGKKLPFGKNDNPELILILIMTYIPRFLVSILFFLDVIYFQKFYYFYRGLCLLLFPFFWDIFYAIVNFLYTKYTRSIFEVLDIKHIPFTEEEKKQFPHGGFIIDIQRKENIDLNELPLYVENKMRDYLNVCLPIKVYFLHTFDSSKKFVESLWIKRLTLMTSAVYALSFGYLMLNIGAAYFELFF